MPAKRELTVRQIRQMLRLARDGVSAREIGRTLGVARSTIQGRGKARGPASGTSHCSQVLNRTSRRVGTRTRLGPSLARVYGG